MDKQPNGVCVHCGKRKYVGMVTCGRSECQEASYLENKARVEAKRGGRKRGKQ